MKKVYLILVFFTTSWLQAQNFDVYGPKPFNEILEDSFVKPWTPSAISTVENLAYVILLDAETKLNAVMLDANDASKLNILDVVNINESGATYSSLLRSMFQIVDINSSNDNAFAGKYQIKPLLHSYNALNYSSTSSEVFTVDIGSFYVADASSSGYLVTEFVGTTGSIKIKASAQYEYNSSTGNQEENTSWTDQWFKIDGTTITLTSTESEATSFFMADVRDLLDVYIDEGSDFNPNSTEWQENPFAAYPEGVWNYDESSFYGDMFSKDVDAVYQTQFGNSEDTDANAAAATALDEIESDLTAEGSSLRYDKSVYLTLRDNLLSLKYGANDIYNGRLGENTVAHVYFTNATDNSGVHHPFMVIASHNTSAGPNFLINVARPPGDGEEGGYAEQSITRNAILEAQLNKIPLKDYGLINNLLDNDLSSYGSLAEDAGLSESAFDIYNYTSLASMGIATDGVVVYPPYNNTLKFAALDAEITSTGIHVGRGMGLHYHADGHAFNGNGINLYNLPDYEGKDHPPLIGFAYDGIALFGKYEANYSSMKGISTGLDEYGGHDHDNFGYHYHTFSQDFTVDGTSFTQHFLFVGAWKGKINDIPGFLQGSAAQLKESDGRYAGAPYEEGEVLALDDVSEIATLYPNPNTGSFRIDTYGIHKISVIDFNGKVVVEKNDSGLEASFEFTGLPKGIFIIKGEGSKTSFTKKLVIE